jgi:hypothetical protein
MNEEFNLSDKIIEIKPVPMPSISFDNEDNLLIEFSDFLNDATPTESTDNSDKKK